TVEMLQPGDKVVLANGTWSDVEFVLKAQGVADQPIELTAEEPGKVIITGQSNLSFSGEHIVVSGLVFKDGYTPTGEVISFRTSKDELANNSRVTNVVVDNFSNPERNDTDIWVAIYGKNNQVDHNSLLNKENRGVTLAVRMNTEASRENNHVIEYNYFGPRQIFGSNGGETMRIGTSHYSREYSNTVVRYNYFDRTNGEHEIISNKACGNEFRGNVFFESQGTLTMRHGHYTVVEGNYFLGNRKPNTGGIRIINENQTVRNNYLYGLTGHRFRGALVIMNGVPNGPINRYDPVIDSVMDNNIVIDSDYIQLCAGADEERSAPPTGSSMSHNIIMSKTNLDPFTIYDDISGISFEGNVLNEEAGVSIESGFSKAPYSVTENEHGLRVPAQSLIDDIGFGEIKLPVTKEETGADFYPKTDKFVAFRTGSTISVAPGTNTILDALANSKPGDTLVLENGGEYLMTKYAFVKHPVTIKTESGEKALVRSGKASFFVIENGGALELENLWIDGADSPDQPGNNVVSTSKYSMTSNYSLIVRDCRVTDLDVNHTFDFLKVYRSTFADSVEILNTEMTNVTGSVLSLDKETDDLGIYNVENVTIKDSKFTDIQGAVANIYRGGTDESTFGPIVVVEGNEFTNTGLGSRNKTGASLKFHGVQKLHISDSEWNESAPLELY
ncbi:MAG: alginate lyase, partial [Rhodothermales bacterium]|nr:alginate lyase [Rhodothermales bacterium]